MTLFIASRTTRILKVDEIPFPCNAVFNAAATKFNDEYILLLRVEDLRGHSVLALPRSEDGYNFTVDRQPIMAPSEDGDFAVYERMGVEDPRITLLEGAYYIVYTVVSRVTGLVWRWRRPPTSGRSSASP